MGFSLQTVLSAILATNILIICLTLIFNHTNIMLKLGYKILTLGIFLIILRLFVPFEFSFTRNIYLLEPLSYIIVQVRQPRLNGYSIWHLLLIIWGLGIGYGLFSYIREHKKFANFIVLNGTNVTGTTKYQQIIDEVCKSKIERNYISIYEVVSICSPMICGVFRPKILLPQSLSLSESELKLVLEHELSHYFHHDLILKMIVQIICIIYWWNPMCKSFQKQVDTILEIRIDHDITHAKQEKKINYFSCLLTVARHSANETLHSPYVVYYCTNSHSMLRQRFEFGLNNSSKKNYIYSSLFIILLIIIYLSSYLFIGEPFYVAPEVEETTIGTMSPDFYYILDEYGAYNIYFQDELIETTDSLKYYHGIRPYEKGAN